MLNVVDRVETFNHGTWRCQYKGAATISQIAEAGFFYNGYVDSVKCWYCDGRLINWKQDDEPWTEHAKWFPGCEYLLQKKGVTFVLHVVASFPNLPRGNDRRGQLHPAITNPNYRYQPATIPSKVIVINFEIERQKKAKLTKQLQKVLNNSHGLIKEFTGINQFDSNLAARCIIDRHSDTERELEQLNKFLPLKKTIYPI